MTHHLPREPSPVIVDNEVGRHWHTDWRERNINNAAITLAADRCQWALYNPARGARRSYKYQKAMVIAGGIVSLTSGATSAMIGVTTDEVEVAAVTAGFSAVSGVVTLLGGIGETTEMYTELFNARIAHWDQAILMLSMYPAQTQQSGTEHHKYVIQLLTRCASSSPGPVPEPPPPPPPPPQQRQPQPRPSVDDVSVDPPPPSLFGPCREDADCANPASCTNGFCMLSTEGKKPQKPSAKQQ
jgi:hypothetical protein